MSTVEKDERAFPNGSENLLTAGQAFAAMFSFLEAFWERDGRPDDSMPKLLSWMQQGTVWANGGPTDPAMWSDWLDAIQRARPQTTDH